MMTFLVHHTCLQGVLIAGIYFGEASALGRYVGIMKTHKGKKGKKKKKVYGLLFVFNLGSS
jgi:hypothetical protein